MMIPRKRDSRVEYCYLVSLKQNKNSSQFNIALRQHLELEARAGHQRQAAGVRLLRVRSSGVDAALHSSTQRLRDSREEAARQSGPKDPRAAQRAPQEDEARRRPEDQERQKGGHHAQQQQPQRRRRRIEALQSGARRRGHAQRGPHRHHGSRANHATKLQGSASRARRR